MTDKKVKIRKKSKFWLGYGIYMGVLLVLVMVLIIYVWNTMKKYEKAQPAYVVEDLIKNLESGDVSSVKTDGGSKFEPEAGLPDTFADEVKGKELTYKVKSSSTYKMVYEIMDDKNEVCEAVITADNERKIMGILSISDWKVASVSAEAASGAVNVKITVPSIYKVTVNGIELGSDEQVGEPVDMEGMKYVAEYVEVPKTVTYEVKGLISNPDIRVADASGNNIDVSSYTDYSNINVGYVTIQIPAELSDYVVTAAKAYSNFFSRDLAGCGESTACLQIYFPQGSYYIDLAEQYRQGDMWMYSRHNTPEFNNVSVEDYTPYSDVCFSCRIIFDKSMYLTATGDTRTEHNDQTYYFVNIDGKWLIADIKSNVED